MARQTETAETSAFEQLFARMVELQEQTAKSNQLQEERTRPRENPNYVADSIFLKPNGEQHAADLKCDVYLNSIHLNKTPLTKAEVDALNALEPIKDVRIAKVDGSMALGSIEPRKDAMGNLDRLTIHLPMKKDDNPQHYPGLVSIAQQFAAQTHVAVPA